MPLPRIADRLAGKRVLLTGASGFLGKAVLAACLRELTDIAELRLLLRAPDDEGARRRLTDEVLASAAFEGAEELEVALEDGRLRAVAGDVARDGLGLADPAALAGIDVAIHCAASVSFEQPFDEMLELNARGPARLLRALREAGGPEPYLVHVSTAYAAGLRTGLVLERPAGVAPAEPDVDLAGELAAARAWRSELEATSRLPEHQRRFVAEARAEAGPAGAGPVGTRAERSRRIWVRDRLTERARERARALGWADGYGLAKALGERALLAERPERLTMVRPSIVESALRTPYPGWLEGLKVADPIILAYARGMVARFPGRPPVRLDIVPVDLVANAVIAAAAHPPEDGVRTIAIASGARNPVTVGEVAGWVTDHFRERPLPDEDGLPVEVPDWRFTTTARVTAALGRAQGAIALGARLVDRFAPPGGETAERRLHRERRRLERLERLAQMYGPYVELDCRFDDREALALLESLAPEDRERFDFDAAQIPWEHYIREVHLPALRAIVAPALRGPAPTGRVRREVVPLGEGPPAIAFFDVEGVVIDATVVHFYAWLRGRGMPAPDRAAWLASLAARAPAWRIADRRSRAAFARAFYREYEGLPADELRALAGDALSEFILPRMRHAAVRRIRAHRRRGDRVVLLTGALDFLVAPLAHLADELVAARLVERAGAFTGDLAEPPLTADGRAEHAALMAADHGVELADCHAYGDAISDLPLLEAVGHAHAVNADFRLAREARRRGWPQLDWPTEPGARTSPLPLADPRPRVRA